MVWPGLRTHRPASCARGSSSGPRPAARPRRCRLASGPPAAGSRAAASPTGALGGSAPAVDKRQTLRMRCPRPPVPADCGESTARWTMLGTRRLRGEAQMVGRQTLPGAHVRPGNCARGNPGDSHQPLGRRRARRCRQKVGPVYTTRATAAHVRRRNKCERPVTRSPEAPLCSVLAAFASSAWPLRNTNGFSVWSRDSQEQGTQPRARGAGDGELAGAHAEPALSGEAGARLGCPLPLPKGR